MLRVRGRPDMKGEVEACFPSWRKSDLTLWGHGPVGVRLFPSRLAAAASQGEFSKWREGRINGVR